MFVVFFIAWIIVRFYLFYLFFAIKQFDEMLSQYMKNTKLNLFYDL